VIEPNLDRVWAALMAGAQPGHTVVHLATSGLDDAPKVRSVILRSADAERGAVSFFTDLRSAKIKEMRRQPRVSLIGYDADAGFQIRLEGKATIDKEGRKKAAAWAACRSHSRTLFQHTLPSGTPIAAPPEAAPADDGDGERHFAVVAVSIIRIDWLDISGPLHLREVLRRLRLARRVGCALGGAPCCRAPEGEASASGANAPKRGRDASGRLRVGYRRLWNRTDLGPSSKPSPRQPGR
jgi:pyridoxamine 5'-phosphate oxidase